VIFEKWNDAEGVFPMNEAALILHDTSEAII
jgi:hypothetical protein